MRRDSAASKRTANELAWAQAQRRHRLSPEHIRMARQLGLHPHKLGKVGNHKQQRWKAALPDFIEGLYFKRFPGRRPDPMTVQELIDAVIDGQIPDGEVGWRRSFAEPADPPFGVWAEIPEDPSREP